MLWCWWYLSKDNIIMSIGDQQQIRKNHLVVKTMVGIKQTNNSQTRSSWFIIITIIILIIISIITLIIMFDMTSCIIMMIIIVTGLIILTCTMTNMSSMPMPRQRKGSIECIGVYGKPRSELKKMMISRDKGWPSNY